jgi:hypothetical protein
MGKRVVDRGGVARVEWRGLGHAVSGRAARHDIRARVSGGEGLQGLEHREQSFLVQPAAAANAEALPKAVVASPYLVSARYDLSYFILAPVLALLLTIVLARFPVTLERDGLFGTNLPWAALFVTIWTNAHLIAVVVRSHGNRAIFRRFPLRFTLVPLCLFLGMLVSDWLLTTGVVVAVLWDVYHSSMQNFGFSRIYDAKAGNPPTRGRTLDMIFNHVVYIGPIFIGGNLAQTIGIINEYSHLGWSGPSQLFNFVGRVSGQLAQTVLIAGGLYIAFYLVAYFWLVRVRGHRLSSAKVWLLLSTASVSILAWGFLPTFQAFFVANFFHGLQYFAIVWATEKRTVQQHLTRTSQQAGLVVAFAAFALFVIGVGTCHTLLVAHRVHVGYALFTVVSLMHFWYDGFIWSVRASDVKASR